MIGKWEMKDLCVTINVPNDDKQGYMPKITIIKNNGNSSWVEEFEVAIFVSSYLFYGNFYQ